MKLGPHYMSGGQATAAKLLQLPIRAIKFAQLDVDAKNDDIPDEPLSGYTLMGLMRQAEAKRLMIVGRRIETYDFLKDLSDGNVDAKVTQYLKGEWCAHDTFEQMVKTFPMVGYWESPNEPTWVSSVSQMARYARFLALFAERLYTETGTKAVLGNWSVGRPDLGLWAEYGPALEAVRLGYAVLGRHSYGPIEGDAGTWYGLRHRRDEVEFQKLGYKATTLLLTEYGADSIFNGQGVEIFKPWRTQFMGDIRLYWNNYLKLFTEELEKDVYVLAGFPFSCGNGNSWQWEMHNYGNDPLVEAMEANPPQAPVFPPPPVILPVEPPAVTPPVAEAWPAWATHVTTDIVNVRQFPFMGELIPPSQGAFPSGKYVHSYGCVIRPDETVLHLIGPDGNMWVTGDCLKARPVAPVLHPFSW